MSHVNSYRKKKEPYTKGEKVVRRSQKFWVLLNGEGETSTRVGEGDSDFRTR